MSTVTSHGPCSPLYASCRKAVPGKAARRKLPPAQRVAAALYCCGRCCVLRCCVFSAVSCTTRACMLCRGRTPALIGYINEAVGILKVRRRTRGYSHGTHGTHTVLTRHAGADSVHQRGGRRLCARPCAFEARLRRQKGRPADLQSQGYSRVLTWDSGDSSRTPESVCRRRGSTCRSSVRRPSRRRRCFNNIMCATTVHIIRRCAITASAECNVQHQL